MQNRTVEEGLPAIMMWLLRFCTEHKRGRAGSHMFPLAHRRVPVISIYELEWTRQSAVVSVQMAYAGQVNQGEWEGERRWVVSLPVGVSRCRSVSWPAGSFAHCRVITNTRCLHIMYCRGERTLSSELVSTIHNLGWAFAIDINYSLCI